MFQSYPGRPTWSRTIINPPEMVVGNILLDLGHAIAHTRA